MSVPLPQLPAEFMVLHGSASSLVLEVHADEAPIWRYWGPRLAEGATPGLPLRDSRPLPSFMLDFDQPLTLVPTFGVGWFGQSALLAHREGRDFAQAFTQCDVEWVEPQRKLRFHLKDAVAAVRVTVLLSLDAHDVLIAKTELTNTGSEPLDVQWLAAATLPLPGHANTVRSYAGQHMHEFLLQVETLGRSLWRRENRRGRTSHDCFPGAVVTTAGATPHTGLVFGAHLAWSGNHQQTIEWLHDGQFQWQLGEWLAPGEAMLAPGATLVTPEVVASCSIDGLNGLAANFHAELRARLNWPTGAMRPRPVHLNTWEGVYFQVDPQAVKALATAAAKVGIERFVLDDGWFHGRHDDTAALGDWWPDEAKFPNGLGDLVEHINALGMSFGLWVEPEMVNPDSELFRSHPDWALQIEGRALLTARNQLVLDISRPQAAQYLFEKISALLLTYPIEYLKWDHNRDLTTAGINGGQPGYRAQVHAVYELLAKLRAAFPAVEIESCSGGGGRIDFAVLRHTHRVWTSDNIDALSRLSLQRGFLQFFPPEVMGSHVGTAPAHTTGRSQAMAFRAAVALPGHLGVELDVRHLGASETRELQDWITTYKHLRDRFHQGKVWLGDGADGLVWQAHADPQCDDMLLLVYRSEPSSHRYTPALQLPMLDTQARYRVRQILPDGAARPTGRHLSSAFFDALSASGGVTLDGSWLAYSGLPMPRAQAQTAFMVQLQKI